MNNEIIGDSMRRVDGRLKVTGAARYTADQHLDGMVYAYGVFSTVSSGRVLRIDTRERAAHAGRHRYFSSRAFPATLSRAADDEFVCGHPDGVDHR